MVCHQKLVRDEAAQREDAQRLFATPPAEYLNLKRARVREVTRAIAKKIIHRYEWLGTLPVGCNVFYGIFFGPYCGGVACYSVGGGGANVNAYKWLCLESQEKLAYLARGACVHWAPKGSAPKLINFSAKMLSEKTGCEAALAYSDTDAGEIGTVYQASGWTCLGWGSSTQQYVSRHGRVYDQKMASNLGKKYGVPRNVAHDAMIAGGYTVQASNPKLRYGLILPAGRGNKELAARFESLKQGYLKRDDLMKERAG